MWNSNLVFTTIIFVKILFFFWSPNPNTIIHLCCHFLLLKLPTIKGIYLKSFSCDAKSINFTINKNRLSVRVSTIVYRTQGGWTKWKVLIYNYIQNWATSNTKLSYQMKDISATVKVTIRALFYSLVTYKSKRIINMKY